MITLMYEWVIFGWCETYYLITGDISFYMRRDYEGTDTTFLSNENICKAGHCNIVGSAI